MSDMTPRQKLIALRDALRAPMPVGFRWDYTEPRSLSCGCAMPLAARLGLTESPSDDVEAAFGLTFEQADKIFVIANAVLGIENWRDVLPTDVADVIDRVLAETPNV